MTHRRVLAWSVLFLFSSAVALNCTSNDTSEFGKSSGGVAPCKAGTEKCECGTGNTCAAGLVCLSNLCVAEPTTATATGSGGTATVATVGSGGGSATGTGGAAASGGAASSSATTGSGGGASVSSTAASSTAATGSGGGSPVACGTNVIDDFSSCDANICSTGGRGGMWHTVAATNVSGQTFMVGVPGGSWLDMSCAALTTGGGGGDYAGIGIKLANGGPYSLMAWSGITLTLESSNNTWLQLVAMDGGVFQSQVIGMAGTSVQHVQPFSSFQKVGGTPGANNLDLTKITDLQVMAADTNGYGFAVHDVTLNN